MSQPTLEPFHDAQLDRVCCEIDRSCLSLEFTTWPGERYLNLVLQQVIHVSYSNTLDSDDIERGPCFIGEINIRELVDGGVAILNELGHKFLERHGGRDVKAYPGTKLYHVHAEGEIVLHFVCGTVDVRYRRREGMP